MILKNKIAVITGATSGIGAACAFEFANQGAEVVVTGRNKERGNNVVSEIKTNGGKAVFHFLDITDDSSILILVDFLRARYGQIDILFNNAGIFPITPPLEELTRDGITEIMNDNATSTLMVSKEIIPIIKKGGTILNNASVAGLHSYSSGQVYAYAASKSAIIKITKILAKQYAPGIRVNALAPGVVKTPIFKNFNEKKYISMIPMGKVASPKDIAQAACFLVSDKASYITGVILPVDGGQSI